MHFNLLKSTMSMCQCIVHNSETVAVHALYWNPPCLCASDTVHKCTVIVHHAYVSVLSLSSESTLNCSPAVKRDNCHSKTFVSAFEFVNKNCIFRICMHIFSVFFIHICICICIFSSSCCFHPMLWFMYFLLTGHWDALRPRGKES